MSYARYRAAASDVEALSGTWLKWKLRQAEAELRASLPFLGDDIFVLIAAELDGCRMLGRLACTAPRFWRKSVPDPTHKGEGVPELWSVAEEGARRRLHAQGEQVRGWVSRETSGGSWLRALRQAEKLMTPLRFAAAAASAPGATGRGSRRGTRSRLATWWCGRRLALRCAVLCAQGWCVQAMVLDLDAATLTVWVNGERKGVMVRPDMTNRWGGDRVARLEGPLRWAVQLAYDATVAIAGPLPPPAVPAAAVGAAAQ